MRTESLPARSKVVYVIPHLSSEESEHFAHIPAFLAALGARMDVVALVERGTPPARLPGVRKVISTVGRSRVARLVRAFSAVRWCARTGYRTYFLRYSRFLLIVLILTYPLFRHRILLWRSGTADMVDGNRRRTLRHRWNDLFNTLLARCAHGFVTGPESMVPVMRARWRIPAHRMRLLYNDIDSDRFAPLPPDVRQEARHRLGWDDTEFVLLFVHRLSFRRGTRLLVPYLDAVRAELDRPVRLVVVGDGPDRSYLEQLGRGRADLRIMGPVPNQQLPSLYGAADCFLMPSYEEGFPRVLLEAMSTALPLVTTRAGGSADVVGPDYPFLCDVGDLPALIRMTTEVARLTSSEREALGVRMRERARERFSPQHVASMLEDIL
ncbi:glycosyltransferase family 4 protein [Nonomuraea aurantiaca]|uniref:glycosyltransferase family 4 protein n=1 Tax=Nonomuraea aurantiaca TaxID=2878562 RepID=UPI001CD983DA|nr:glycosyltransferase family 4 protein [Nonomuraea aurantiaca]MCA2229193.1 glycosyltransferase family 4 protein [Nonomuraea aurantiaca]